MYKRKLRGSIAKANSALVIIIGNSGVGKSSVMGRWTRNHFLMGLPSTIHVELSAKTFKCGDTTVKVQLWDTGSYSSRHLCFLTKLAGQERFNSITRNYYRGAHGAVLVYVAGEFNPFCQI